MDKLKLKIGAIRGVCNLCLDKIYFYEKEEITKEKLEEEIDVGISLIKSFLKELEETKCNMKNL